MSPNRRYGKVPMRREKEEEGRSKREYLETARHRSRPETGRSTARQYRRLSKEQQQYIKRRSVIAEGRKNFLCAPVTMLRKLTTISRYTCLTSKVSANNARDNVG